jgi:uncharacterized RDD family membrane protein YckC
MFPPLPPPPRYQPGRDGPPYASWGRRLGAALLDLLLLLPFYALAVAGLVLAVSSSSTDPTTDELQFGASTAVGFAVMGLGYLGILGFQIWNQIFRQGRTGASLGKKWMSIRVISEETFQPTGPLMTFVRQLVHVVDSLPCYVGYLWPIWDDKKQTFADKIMKTVVVHDPDFTASPPA